MAPLFLAARNRAPSTVSRPTAATIPIRTTGDNMLQALRGKKSGLLVKIILGVIVIGFSFFGIESYFVATRRQSVAQRRRHRDQRRSSSASASTRTASA